MMQSRDITQLSNSSLDKFDSCPLSYYHRYLNPERPKAQGTVDFYGHYGSLIHFFCEYFPRTNFYRDMPFTASRESDHEDLQSYLNSYGNRLMERESGLNLDEMMIIFNELMPIIDFPDQAKRDEYYRQGVAFIETIPDMDWSKVIGIEAAFEIDILPNVPKLVGFIDKVERDERGIIITDYKTSKPYSKNAIMQKSQLQKYGMASWFLYGELPHTYRYHFTRFNKTVEVEIPQEDLTRVKNLINFQYAKISHCVDTGSFPPRYNKFYCNAFCGYAHLCPAFEMYN